MAPVCALFIRANIEETDMRRPPRFQRTVRFLIRDYVAYEWAKQFKPVDDYKNDDWLVPDDLLNVSVSLSANPWLEMYEASDPTGEGGEAVMRGLANAGRAMHAIASGRRGSGSISMPPPSDDAPEQVETDRLRALVEKHTSDYESNSAVYAEALRTVVAEFGLYTVSATNFSVACVPLAVARDIRNAASDLANYASWTAAQSALPFPSENSTATDL